MRLKKAQPPLCSTPSPFDTRTVFPLESITQHITRAIASCSADALGTSQKADWWLSGAGGRGTGVTADGYGENVLGLVVMAAQHRYGTKNH